MRVAQWSLEITSNRGVREPEEGKKPAADRITARHDKMLVNDG